MKALTAGFFTGFIVSLLLNVIGINGFGIELTVAAFAATPFLYWLFKGETNDRRPTV